MIDVPTSASPPPGWYAESPHAARLRWWNGSAWTEHYQTATDTSAIPAPVETPAPVVEPVPEPLPTTRAARRAASTAAIDTSGADQPVPVWAAMPSGTTEHEPTAGDSLGGGKRAQPAIWPPSAVVEPFGWATPPLPPATYPPRAYVAASGANFIPVTSRNGPASASLALSFLGVVAGILVSALVTSTNPSLAGLLNLLIIAAFLSALGLAVVGLVLAARRPTRKGKSVFALVVSALLLIGTCTAFALRLIPVGALHSAG